MSSTGTNKMGLNSNSNSTLHKIHHYHNHHNYHHHNYQYQTHKKHKNSGNSTCSTSSQDGSSSSIGIYIDEHDLDNLNITEQKEKNNDIIIIKEEEKVSIETENDSLQSHNNKHKHKQINDNNLTRNALFGHDYTEYMPSIKLFQKLGSAQEYYSNLHISKLPIFNSKKHKDRRSDCPSEISSIDSRRRRKKKISSIRRILSWMKYINSIICQIVKITFDFIILSCNKLQKWQKDIQEAPIEIKEKYFFVISTIISTILFYILFLCLDFMIKHWFALPHFITEYSFSISYCISYLTSVIWQHFLNQYFVFALKTTSITTNDNDNFCDSLIRTYLVYGMSLFMTGIIGSILQIYAGMADEFVLILTLPISGIMNYYLLRYCHHNNNNNMINNNNNSIYQPIPTNDNIYHPSKPRHLKHQKYSKSTSVISYNHHHHHHHTKSSSNKIVDDIVIV